METPAGGQILLPVAAWQEKRAVPGDFLRYPAGPGLETSGNDAMVFPRRSPSFPRTDDTYEALPYGKFIFSHLCKTTEFCPEALARPPGCRGEMRPRRRGVAGVANADRLPSGRVFQAPLPERRTVYSGLRRGIRRAAQPAVTLLGELQRLPRPAQAHLCRKSGRNRRTEPALSGFSLPRLDSGGDRHAG